MLEGLEISVVQKCEIDNNNRIDSEYYKKHYIAQENQIKANKHFLLDDVVSFLIGPFGSAFDTENYLENGIYRYVRGQDVKPFIFRDDDCRYIPKEDFQRLEKYSLKENDVLVSVVGTLGNACIVQAKDTPAIFSCKSTVLRTNGMSSIYILTYLNCKYGKELLLRRERGAIQKGLNLEDLKSTIIPNLSDNMQKAVENAFYSAQDKLECSKQLYSHAEVILLEELGLKDWMPINKVSTEKTFADFLASGRLDAEYYQPKYDNLFAHLKQYETKLLSQIVTVNKSIEPGSEAYQEDGIPFLRVSNLSKFGLSKPDIHLDRLTYEADILKPKKDTILLSKDGSVGIAYKLEQDLDAITSGAILHLRVIDKEFQPDYLTLVLNSIIVKMQAERDAGGSIIQHWKPSEIGQVVIPKLSKELQIRIVEKIKESFALKAESKRLLDLAQTAIETAIECGEQKALEFIIK